ncbi:MAG TPA: polysaccharide biosynthesis/export family protein [Pyrinomonadaceae bacterium]|jgi:polysaccharide export outer membrane protein|nr:polysaccharide biosynthesis/export family protein [Pyrinomonadaceae bacterium]
MKLQAKLNAAALAAVLFLSMTAGARTTPAQDDPSGPSSVPKTEGAAASSGSSSTAADAQATTERLEPDDVNTPQADISPAMQAGRREQASEDEAAVLPYYNNYLTTYRLGPEDVISVTVFGQERYSKTGIIVPPNGKINYPLVPEGILVAGKTTEQVAEELTRRLDEYIIDPKITVALEKAQSARFSVLGDVAQPGIRIMTRRLSVYEALAEAGGVLDTGDKSKVMILRRRADGTLNPIRVNIKEIERGRAREMAYLAPGDQVIVPGNTFKKFKEVMNLLPILSFARIFTGGW